jgi:hypothetical protein
VRHLLNSLVRFQIWRQRADIGSRPRELDLSAATLCLLATKFLRIGERDHRAGEPRIVAVQCAAPDGERLRERSFRSLSVARDLMEEPLLTKPVCGRGITPLQAVRACAKYSFAIA